jgi:hypothetical protein
LRNGPAEFEFNDASNPVVWRPYGRYMPIIGARAMARTFSAKSSMTALGYVINKLASGRRICQPSRDGREKLVIAP